MAGRRFFIFSAKDSSNVISHDFEIFKGIFQQVGIGS